MVSQALVLAVEQLTEVAYVLNIPQPHIKMHRTDTSEAACMTTAMVSMLKEG